MAIRRWSDDTLLNGMVFTDATLSAGDRVSVGPLEFEVLVEKEQVGFPAQEIELAGQETGSPHIETHSSQGLIRKVDSADADISHLEDEIAKRREDSVQLQQRLGQLEMQLAQSIQPRSSDMDSSQVRVAVERLERKLADHRQNYEKDRDVWLAQCKQVSELLQIVSEDYEGSNRHEQTQLSERAEQLDQRFQQILDRERALSEQQTELERARHSFDERLQAWENQRNLWRNEFDRDRQQFEAERQLWQQEQAQRHQELDERSHQLQDEFARLAADRQSLEKSGSQQDDQRRRQLDQLADRCESLQRQLDGANAKSEQAEIEWKQRLEEKEWLRGEAQGQLESLQEQWNQQRGALESELLARQADLQDVRQKWEDERQQAESELSERSRRLDEEWQRLCDEREKLEQARENDASQQKQCELAKSELAQRRQQLDEEWQQLAGDRQTLDEERQAWESGRHEQVAELNTRCDQLSRDIDAARQRSAELQSELEQYQEKSSTDNLEFESRRAMWDQERQRLESELEVTKLELSHLRDQWQADREAAQSELDIRAEELEKQRRQLIDDQEALQKDRTDWEIERERQAEESQVAMADRTMVLAAPDPEATSRQAEFEQAQQQWETQRQQQEEEISARQSRLDEEFQQLAGQREAFERQREESLASEQRQVDVDAQMSEWEETRQREEAELLQAREQFDAERQAWEAARDHSEMELEQRIQDVESQLTQTPTEPAIVSVMESQGMSDDAGSHEDERSTTEPEVEEYQPEENSDEVEMSLDDVVAQLRAEAVAHGAEAYDAAAPNESNADEGPMDQADDNGSAAAPDEEEISFSAPKEEPPIDTASILAKFGHSIDADEEEGAEEAFVASTFEPPGQLNTETSVAIADEDHGEDGSIEDYMSQLLQRVASGPTSGQKVQLIEPPKEEEPPAVDASDTAVKTEPITAVEETTPLNASDFIPRAVAPEGQSNLRALRDVANTSARSAIDKHQRKRSEHLAMILSFVGVFSLVVCVTMAMWTQGLYSITTLVAACAFSISAFCLTRAFSLTAKAKLSGRTPVASEPDEELPKTDAPIEAAVIEAK